jgi:hypothetical protein
MKLGSTALILASALTLAGCSKKAPETLPPAPATGGAQVGEDIPAGVLPGSQADFLTQTGGQDTIYFDTDRFNVDSVDAAVGRCCSGKDSSPTSRIGPAAHTKGVFPFGAVASSTFSRIRFTEARSSTTARFTKASTNRSWTRSCGMRCRHS